MEPLGEAGWSPDRDPRSAALADLLLRLPGGRRLGLREAEALLADPVWFAALLVASGRAVGGVGGPLERTVAAARATLGPSPVGPGLALAWSVEVGERFLLFGMPAEAEATAEELAGAASALAASAPRFLAGELRLAFLSFSTLGSAVHPRVERVREARRIVEEGSPDFAIEGELQLDAAIVPEVAARKAATSAVAGRANLLLFPDRESGRIAVELTRHLAGARAIGPLLLGPARPLYPCPECRPEEILELIERIVYEAEWGSA